MYTLPLYVSEKNTPQDHGQALYILTKEGKHSRNVTIISQSHGVENELFKKSFIDRYFVKDY